MTDDSTDPRFAGLPGRPGKIVAIHLSYASRADQRGRRPAHPSYFLKPSSSVAPSGGTVERPDGTELLAFEGEIALVIGTTARRVPLDRAWDHVAWVTAANDLGLYDLRANDKGSNVRSKGGDGFTPVGPDLVDARAVDPDALRLRTWVNGELRQEDTTAGLLFTLPQVVADLSQHLTLEPGDVILTGTPAGSSVIVPGDVVEIEVDAPDASGSPTSGRLVTTVTQGERAFDGELGSLPAVDDVQRAEAWGVEPAPARFRLTAELRDKLLRVPVAGLSAQLRKRGLNTVTVDGVRPTHPDAKLVGTNRRVRAVPTSLASGWVGRTPSTRARSSSSRRAARPGRARSATSSPCARTRAAPRGSSPTAGSATTPPSPPSASRSGRRVRTLPSSAACTCRGTSTSPSPAAGPPSSPATSSSATGTVSSTSHPRWPRRTSTPPTRRRRRTAGSPSRSPPVTPSRVSSR